jgi:hypothetical protein
MNDEQRVVLRSTLVAALDLAPVFAQHKVASLVQQAANASDDAAIADGHRR